MKWRRPEREHGGNVKVNVMHLLLIPLGKAWSALEVASPSPGLFLLLQKPYDSSRAAQSGTFSKTRSCQNIRREPRPSPYTLSAKFFARFGSPVEQLRQEKVMEDTLGWESGDTEFSFLCSWFSCDWGNRFSLLSLWLLIQMEKSWFIGALSTL